MIKTLKVQLGSLIEGWDHEKRTRVQFIVDNIQPWGYGGTMFYQTPKRKELKKRRAFIRSAYVYRVL
jgi:hypothetical protein